MIIEHRTYLGTCDNLCNCNYSKRCDGCVRRFQTGELRFFNSPNLRTAEDVIQLYKQNSPGYITHTSTKLYGVDEFHYYVSEFTATPYDPEMGLIYPEPFKPTREELRAELIRLGIIFDNTEHTDIKTAFRTATATANNFKAWRELKYGKDGE